MLRTLRRRSSMRFLLLPIIQMRKHPWLHSAPGHRLECIKVTMRVAKTPQGLRVVGAGIVDVTGPRVASTATVSSSWCIRRSTIDSRPGNLRQPCCRHDRYARHEQRPRSRLRNRAHRIERKIIHAGPTRVVRAQILDRMDSGTRYAQRGSSDVRCGERIDEGAVEIECIERDRQTAVS